LCQIGKKEKASKKGDRMIVKMKEIYLFTLSSSVEETIQTLGELGVVEIREISQAEKVKIESISEKVLRANTAISILENFTNTNNNNKKRKKYHAVDPARITDRILITGDIRKRCQETLKDYNQQLKWYETWGKNIDLKDFQYLKKKGINIHLYLVEDSDLNLLPKKGCIVRLTKQEKKTPIVLFARSSDEELDFKEEPSPSLPLETIKRQIVRKKRQLEEVDFYLADQTENIAILHDYKSYLQDRLNSRKALVGMGDIEGNIKFLRGFIPHSAVNLFKNKAQQNKWGYRISDPERLEEVPVYIKNPKWVSIINPVMKFIDIVPGYKEVDVSIYFLVAFSLFFAMLVGDAGYGAIFLLITFLFGKKLGPQMRVLIYLLSGATILWGVLSGTYFGSEQIAAIPFFKNLIIPEIASFGVDNISFMMHLSFLIGAIHLTIAHSVRFLQFINSSRALSEIGWISFVWGLFFVAEKLVLGKEMSEWHNWLFILGAGLVTLFSQEGKNFINSMVTSIANLPLSLINGFSDIVSYVRLFAVGMATATVASSFNNMILPEGVDLSFLEILMAAIALLLGHGLNIVLALMAVMVHGIRLNMLEFAGHLGIQFSGEAYQPFKLNGSKNERDR
jgi:V/A-type H+-transporting ATPase subunit I